MRTVTFDEVVAGLHKAVELEGPDHRAECIIADGGPTYAHPVCIVGQVLYQLEPEKFKDACPDGNVTEPAQQVGIELEERAERVLKAAQLTQDGDLSSGAKVPWGLAVEFSEKYVDIAPLDSELSYTELEDAFEKFLQEKDLTLAQLDPYYVDPDYNEDED